MSKKTTKTYYTTEGSCRGECGHHHRTLTGAARCMQRDESGCKSQGGYSDRRITEWVDGVRTDTQYYIDDDGDLCQE